MVSLAKALETVVKEGATLSAVFGDGSKFGSIPILWMKQEEGQLVYLLAGEDHEHIHGILSSETDDDGNIVIQAQGGLILSIEPLWDPDNLDDLRKWIAYGKAEGWETPPGAWTYGRD